MTPPVWLRSTAGGDWHAFPADQLDDQTRSSYDALCGFSIPVDQADRTPPSPLGLHRDCLVGYGEPMPDNHKSEEG
jgi:hypothetical protein